MYNLYSKWLRQARVGLKLQLGDESIELRYVDLGSASRVGLKLPLEVLFLHKAHVDLGSSSRSGLQ